MESNQSQESLVLRPWPDVGKALGGLSRATVYSLINQGVIPHIRCGRSILVPRKALEEFLASAVKPENDSN